MSKMQDAAERLARELGPHIARELTEAVLALEPGRRPEEVVGALEDLASAWKRLVTAAGANPRPMDASDFKRTVDTIDGRLKQLYSLHVAPTLPVAVEACSHRVSRDEQ